ncbi:MAG: DUF5996 family protein, partial [Myxococcota bacterium]
PWEGTCDALHRWTQIVGKYRLAATPWVNHSWHATLYVSPRGLTTGPIHTEASGVPQSVELIFDFHDHELRLEGSSGVRDALPLEAMSVAEFWQRFHALVERHGLSLKLHGTPNEIEGALPFAEDTEPRPYDRDAVERFHHALIHIHRVMLRFRTAYVGKVSPVHLFWGSFDVAVTRFSGRGAPDHPGGIPGLPDDVTREAYSHEVSSAGFWPGKGLGEPAFYSYAYPTPEGFSGAAVEPAEATYHEGLGEFVLPYEAVRTSDSPDETLMRFLETTWQAASRLGDWPHGVLECPVGKPLVPRPALDPSTDTAEPTIQHEESESRGRYAIAAGDGDEAAEMTYSRAGDDLIIVDHTYVPDVLRGRGVGARLAERLVADAKAKGRRIIPLCPFFRHQVERHPEWAELIA